MGPGLYKGGAGNRACISVENLEKDEEEEERNSGFGTVKGLGLRVRSYGR